uniref:microfibril-associated glycoprotein 4-like n=1 Tax=Styela clava TaxID=7725 RepID=UPI0019398D97|nr:microfibril-associated glycoprotein 4-like [Styela clava]
MTKNGNTANLLTVPTEEPLGTKSLKGSSVTINVPPVSSPNTRRRISAISAQDISMALKTVALQQQQLQQTTKNGKTVKLNKKNKKSRKRSKFSSGAIFLCLLVAIAAVGLSAYLYGEVRRIDQKLMLMTGDLDRKADVIVQSLLKDCSYATPWDRIHGITRVYPVAYPYGIEVYCDEKTDGGGWTVFQRRLHGKENFQRKWNAYVKGFGELEEEFWMGLERIHQISSDLGFEYELRIDMKDFDNNTAYAQYSKFRVGPASSGYELFVNGYSGTAGDSLQVHNRMKFTTTDQDNDLDREKNCALYHHGPWWHRSCHSSNLNGRYKHGVHKTYADGVNWRHWKGDYYSLKFVEMKMRRKI